MTFRNPANDHGSRRSPFLHIERGFSAVLPPRRTESDGIRPLLCKQQNKMEQYPCFLILLSLNALAIFFPVAEAITSGISVSHHQYRGFLNVWHNVTNMQQLNASTHTEKKAKYDL